MEHFRGATVRLYLLTLLLAGFAIAFIIHSSPAETTPPAKPDSVGAQKETASHEEAIRTKNGVIFPEKTLTPYLFSSCREAKNPQKFQSDWSPGPENIAALEKDLPLFFKKLGNEAPRPPLNTYLAQYAGFTCNGKKQIYANFFDRRDIDDLRDHTGKLLLEGKDWLHSWVHVLDGGDHYFQLEYDIDSHTFVEFHKNGEA